MRFVFVALAIKFARFSLFSRANHLVDISLAPRFAYLRDFTEKMI
jgi:hypothetical protein